MRAALQGHGRGIKISNAMWKQLETACASYIAMENSVRAAPRLKDVLTHSSKLIEAFDTLRNLLHEPDEGEVLAKIHAIDAFERTFENFNPGQLITSDANAAPRTLDAAELRRLCALAAHAAKEAIKENRLRAEREPPWPLPNFIGRLEKWSREIGVPATARKDDHEIPSAFVTFVKAVFNELPKESRPKFSSNHAIATRIYEVRKNRRTSGRNTT
jgi:hypothetical protein